MTGQMRNLAGDRGGITFEADRDGERLNRQARDVWRIMTSNGPRWFTLREIELHTGHPQSSISARLRDFRKPKFGGHSVERCYMGDGLWAYQVTVNDGSDGP